MKRFIFALPLLAILSCQNDEVSITPPTPPNADVKLDYYIETFELSETHSQQIKVEYEYDFSGKVSRYTISSSQSNSGLMSIDRYFKFSYVNDRVDKISGYLPHVTDPYIEYSYLYLPNSNVSKISEKNYTAGINSEANFSYDPIAETVKIMYTFSNGQSFEYELYYNGKNILNTKTTKGAQLCNDGQYTYDQNINPFWDLGYLDYNLNNLSMNNKLTEHVNYVGCAFPTLIPESHTYEYDSRRYPIIVTTLYKSNSNTKSQKRFFYK